MTSFKIKPRHSIIELSLYTLEYIYNIKKIKSLPESVYSSIIVDFYNSLNLGDFTVDSCIPATIENIDKLKNHLTSTKDEVYQQILALQGVSGNQYNEITKIKFHSVDSYNGFINNIKFSISYPSLLLEDKYIKNADLFLLELYNPIVEIQRDISENDKLSFDYFMYDIEGINLKDKSILISIELYITVKDIVKSAAEIKNIFGAGEDEYFYEISIFQNLYENRIKMKFFKHITLEE